MLLSNTVSVHQSRLSHRQPRLHWRELAAILSLLALLLVPGASVYARPPDPDETPESDEIAVYFTPGDQATEAIVEALAAAKKTVHVQAYSFTSAPIAAALVAAEKRGVQVKAILDKSNRTAKYSAADFLAHEGVPTYIDAKHAIAHNKIMIIDDETVITGSFNFTKAAQEKNAENLLIIQNEDLAERYEQNWEIHLAHSERYIGR